MDDAVGRSERTRGRALFHKRRATQIPRYKALPPRGEAADVAYLDTDDKLYYWNITTASWVVLATGGAGHTEDHDHDGTPTQKLLATNTHESPAADTHHTQVHVLSGADHTGPISDAQHPAIVSGDLHAEYMNVARHNAVGDGTPHHTFVVVGDTTHTVSIGGQILQGVAAAPTQQGHVKLANHLGGTANLPEVNNHNVIASGGLHSEYALAANTHGTPSADTHHAETHAPESHSGTDITGAELEDLSDGGATTLHTHAGPNGIRALVFTFPDEELAVAVLIPRPSWILLDNHAAPASESDQRFTVTADTVGAGTNTVILESTTTSPFTGSPSWTARATLALGTSKRVSTTSFGGWTWDPTTEYLRVRCSVVNATAPKEVLGYFEWE